MCSLNDYSIIKRKKNIIAVFVYEANERNNVPERNLCMPSYALELNIPQRPSRDMILKTLNKIN